MSHIRRCRPEIIQLLERRARYGLTYRELSEESGISISTFAYWAAKLRGEEEDAPRFVPVDVVDEEEGVAIKIETDSGLRVVVEPGFDEQHLARILSWQSNSFGVNSHSVSMLR